MNRRMLLVAGTLVVLSIACGGGGGSGGGGGGGCGGGGGGGGTGPQPGITFTPGGSGAKSIALTRSTSSTATRLVLLVSANEVNNLFGVGFELTYPVGLFRFEGSSEGGFLRSDGNPTSYQIAEPSPGRLVIGVSRLGAVTGVGGSGTLVELELTAIAAGDGAFAFSRNQAFSASGAVQADMSWFGGTVRVVL